MNETDQRKHNRKNSRQKQSETAAIRETVKLAAQIQDKSQQLFAMAGILTFTDKVIDMKTANKIRRMIGMTKVGWIIEQEKQQIIAKAEEKQRELANMIEEKQQELARAEEEKRRELARSETEKQQAARESVVKMIRKNYPTEEIAFIVSGFSQDDIEAVRRELAEKE